MLPAIVIAIATTFGATVPVYVGVPDGWNLVGMLIDVEFPESMRLTGYEPGPAFSLHGENTHATGNENLTACREDGNRLRVLVLGYGKVETDESLPALLLHFEGTGAVDLTCWNVKEPDGDDNYMTFVANVTLERPDGELWEVAQGYPETGTLEVLAGGIMSSPLAVRSDSWGAVKELYR